jgi:hypothetical protein
MTLKAIRAAPIVKLLNRDLEAEWVALAAGEKPREKAAIRRPLPSSFVESDPKRPTDLVLDVPLNLQMAVDFRAFGGGAAIS